MRLSATEAIHRGLLSARANWELSVVVWLQSVLVAAIVAVGLIPPLMVLGLDALPAMGADASGWSQLFDDSLEQLAGDLLARLGPLLAAVLATLAVWTLAFILYCFIQAGVLATLIAADRQCIPGPPPDWRLFRTFSPRALIGWGRRYLWRYFWLFNLFLVFHFVGSLLVLCLFWLAVVAYQRWGGPAAVGFGCGGALPLIFGMLVLGLCLSLAQADLARQGGSVWAACRRSVSVLGARLGAVALIAVATALAGLTIGLGFTLFPILLTPFAGPGTATQIALQSAATLLQWLASSVLSLIFFAALVALVQDQRTAVP